MEVVCFSDKYTSKLELPLIENEQIWMFSAYGVFCSHSVHKMFTYNWLKHITIHDDSYLIQIFLENGTLA